MAGLYIHIPFCKQKCSYCDFHFSTSLKYKQELLQALIKELSLKKTIINTPIETIYFGGGTPSLLNEKDLELIIDAIYNNYEIAGNKEFTLECNPDDLTPQKLKELKKAGVNRLSIGIQSFFDDDLYFFNRAHNSKEAVNSVLISQEAGFENITIDLIYGFPLLTDKKWEENLATFNRLNVPHLSAYTLTIEPKTALHYQLKTGQVNPLSDEKTLAQFSTLIQRTKEYGLTQYEVSNFGKEGFYSVHNSNYWKGVAYLGIGPSAHSYVNGKRCWNAANNRKYIQALLKNDNNYFKEELIDEDTAYNEYILTRLRTIWGIDKAQIKRRFSEKLYRHFENELNSYTNSPYIDDREGVITLSQEGLFIADKITSDLFYIE